MATTKTTPEALQELGLPADRLPRHVAVIMDGNGRWASARHLPRAEGHRRGVKSVRAVIETCVELGGIEQLTLYCLSSENWKRPRRELDMLMKLLEQYVIEERSEIIRQDLQFSMIGRTEGLTDRVLKEVEQTVQCSRENQGMKLCLAVNYGSRGELVDAVGVGPMLQQRHDTVDDAGARSDHQRRLAIRRGTIGVGTCLQQRTDPVALTTSGRLDQLGMDVLGVGRGEGEE